MVDQQEPEGGSCLVRSTWVAGNNQQELGRAWSSPWSIQSFLDPPRSQLHCLDFGLRGE